jgi:hypothetical protein
VYRQIMTADDKISDQLAGISTGFAGEGADY